MPLKVSAGNMYDWTTHTHSHLGGQCPHRCVYCYVQRNRFGVAPRYQGPVRLLDNEFTVDYGVNRTIFIEHMNDMLAKEVPESWVVRILEHCAQYPENKYVFQSKNPGRASRLNLPAGSMFGTTIETNREIAGVSQAPIPWDRAVDIKLLRRQGLRTFITIEPLLDFDVETFAGMIIEARPEFVNIGADSKGCDLPEPSAEKVMALVAQLQAAGVNIRKKTNLARILGGAR